MAGLAYDHYRVTFNGNLDTAQSMSFGLSMTATVPPADGAAVDADLLALLGPANAYFGHPGGPDHYIRGIDSYTEIRGYWYPAGASTAALQNQRAMGPFIGSGGGDLPQQAAICVSLRGASPGRHHMGRAYLPAAGTPLISGQLSPGVASTIGVQFAAFINAINALTISTLPRFKVVIASRLAAPTEVTRVVVDSRIDSQRRRADKQVPDETSSHPV